MLYYRKSLGYSMKYIFRSIPIAVLLGFVALAVRWLVGGMYMPLIDLGYYAISYLCLAEIIVTLVLIILELRYIKKQKRMMRDVYVNGYTDEYFEKCKKTISKYRSYKAVSLDSIYLSAIYADAKRFDEALTLLKSLDISAMKKRVRAMYYCTLSYVLYVSGDVDGACAAWVSNEAVLRKYSKRKGIRTDLSCGILFVNWLLHYTDEDEYGSQKVELEEIRSMTTNELLLTECSVMLCIKALRDGELSAAKSYASDAYNSHTRYGEKQRIQKLMKIIENAYNVCEQEKQEKTLSEGE